MQRCLPTLERYAQRHACKLTLWGGEETVGYPSPKFVIERILSEFLAGHNEWCVWIDADVWIHEDAPLLTEELASGFHMAADPSEERQRMRWHEWCRQNGWRTGRWIYRNAGVWCCDRTAATQILLLMTPPYRVGLQEQHHLNWWLYQLQKQGGAVPLLDRVWNAGVPQPPLKGWKGGWFVHLLSNKTAKLEAIDQAGGFEVFRPVLDK